jgi:hypothetical protein
LVINLASIVTRFCRTLGSQPITVNHDMSGIAMQHD